MNVQTEPLLTINDLDALPDDDNRYEIIEGELFVSRTPSLLHQRIFGNLHVALRNYLEKNPIGEVIITPGLILSEYNAVIPDLVFIAQEQHGEIASGDRLIGAPKLVIEIVSPGAENEKRDRVIKRQLYGKYSVREYWVVDPLKRIIEVYWLEGQTLQLKAEYAEGDELTSAVMEGFTLQVDAVFHY